MAAGKFYRATKKVQKVQIVPKKTKTKKYAIMRTPYKNIMTTKLRYSQSLQLVGGGPGAPSGWSFNATGLYDPDYTGVGHQPRGFDQLMTMYDHFVVIQARCTVWFASPTAGTINNMCALSLADNGSTITSSNSIMEYGNRVVKPLPHTGEPIKLTYVYTPRFLGRKNPMSDPELKGSTTANPAEGAFFHASVFSLNGTANTAPTDISVVIDYVVKLIEPTPPPQS